MSSVFDKNLLPEFESIKDDDEVIIWTGKPRFIPYVVTISLLINISMWVGGLWFWVYYVDKMFKSGGFESGIDSFSVNLWMITFLPIIIGFFVPLIRYPSYSNTAYGFSNKRVMLRTGFIGTDFKTIDFDKIQDIQVNVNVIERMFNVGSVRFYFEEDGSSKFLNTWLSIEKPYEVFKMVKQTSMDIKTDINYANELRPDSNKGYKTKYDPKG